MAVRNKASVLQAMLDAFETAIGATARFKVFTGAVQATFGTAPAGTLLVDISLGDFMQAATAPTDTSATKVKVATTISASAAAAGTAGCYAITDSAGTTIFEDGTVTATGGGGDTTIDNTSIASGQTVTLTGYTKNL